MNPASDADTPGGAAGGPADGGAGHSDAWTRLAARAPAARDEEEATGPRTHSGHHRRHRSRRSQRRRRIIAAAIGGVVLAALVAGGIVALLFLRQAGEVDHALQQARSGLSALPSDVKSGDHARIERTANRISGAVATAARTVDGPLWSLAAAAPVVGRDVDAVQRVTRAANILTTRALQPGLRVMKTMSVDQLTLKDGGIDLSPFTEAQASVPAIASAFRAAGDEIAPIDQAGLTPAVAQPVGQVVSMIDAVGPQLDLVQKNLPTLLDLAGARGKKTYLLIFQNNAEVRATGGNPAASMILTVQDGHLKTADQANSATLAASASGDRFTTLPPATAKLYRDTFTRSSQDFTMSPDFPTTAKLFRNLFAHTSGQQFDGVISLDPVVLSHMLAVAGPVKLDDGQMVTAGNAVQLLLKDAYAKYPTGEESDAFFADVAQRVFTHLLSTRWDPAEMFDALVTSAKEQRVWLNFTDHKAQAMAAELGVDGALPRETSERTTLGMFLNDSSVGKLEYYLTTTISVVCDARARTVTETMTLRNTAPADLTGGYVLGERNAARGIPRTTMMLDVLTFAPPGAKITATDPQHGRIAAWDRSGTEKGSSAVSRTVFVPAGKTVTVSSTVKLPAGKLGPLDLRYTPTAHGTSVSITPSCAALMTPAAG